MANGIGILHRAALAVHCIDNQADLAILDHIHDVRATLRHLVYHSHGHARFSHHGSGAARGQHGKAHIAQTLGDVYRTCLVFTTHADEYLARRWQLYPRCQLRFYKGFGKRVAHAHYFAGGFHFRPKYDIHTRELDERKHRFFDRIIWRNDLFSHALLLQRLAHHAARRHFGQRNAGGLGYEGHGARRAGIHFQHIYRLILNGELHIH